MSAARDSGSDPELNPSAANPETEDKEAPTLSQPGLPQPEVTLSSIRGPREQEQTEVMEFVQVPPPQRESSPRVPLRRTPPELQEGSILSNASLVEQRGDQQSASEVRSQAKVVTRTAKLDEEIPRLVAKKEEQQKNFFRSENSPNDWEDTIVGAKDDDFGLESQYSQFEKEASEGVAEEQEYTLTGSEDSSQELWSLETLVEPEPTSQDELEALHPSESGLPLRDESERLSEEDRPDFIPYDLANIVPVAPVTLPPKSSDPLEATVNTSHDDLEIPEEFFPEVLNIGEVKKDTELGDTMIGNTNSNTETEE